MISRSEPSPPAFCAPILFFLFLRKERIAAPGEERKENSETGSANRAAIASEEASSIPFPPGRRKLHIRSLLLPSQIVTVSLGHNLAIWNFTTPHAILMMADRRHFADTVCRGRKPEKGRTLSRPALCIIFSSIPSQSAGAATKTHRRGCQADPSGRTRPSPARRRPCRRRSRSRPSPSYSRGTAALKSSNVSSQS